MSQADEREQLLVVEDDASLRAMIAEVLEDSGYGVAVAANGREALEVLQSRTVDLVVTDIVMPGMRGDELLAEVHAAFPEVPVIAVTAFGSIEGAVALTRAGAADYLTKPFRTPALLASVSRVLEESRPRREESRARREAGAHLTGLVGRSRPMVRLFDRLGRIAGSPAPVLITGETGTGKERFARALHQASGRDPFVPVSCASVPGELMEPALFGHAAGALPGADREGVGAVEAADGGTLFLDDVSELPLAVQPRLLRFLQTGEFQRVGEVETRWANVRLITASRRDLPRAVREGTFREDLFFRVDVLHLDIPPLRERPTDIPLLAEHILSGLAEREGREELRLSPAAAFALAAHPWPGNVRELQNVVEQAALVATGPEVRLEDLPPHLAEAGRRGAQVRTAADRGMTLDELEREYTLEVLRRCGGNKSRAAEELGVPRRTLYRRLEEYGLLSRDE